MIKKKNYKWYYATDQTMLMVTFGLGFFACLYAMYNLWPKIDAFYLMGIPLLIITGWYYKSYIAINNKYKRLKEGGKDGF